MNSRILINVAAFAALGVVLVVWAFSSVVRFDFIERPYQITVVFESSPGLHPNFEVDYLGTRIGKIDSVRLRDGQVVVKLDIDRNVRIPRAVTAAAARKSAVGEPVVELTPKPGQADGPRMPTDGSGLIPVTDTSVPPKYGDLFGAVNKTLKAIDPDSAGSLLHELAVGWAGREDSLRQIITGSDQITATFARDTELVDQLTADMGRIAAVLADNRRQLGSGIDDLAALTAALRQVRGEIARLRDRGPNLLATVNGLLAETGPDINCAVDALAGMDLTKHNPGLYEDLRQTLVMAGPLVNVLTNIIGEDQGQKVLNIVFMMTFNAKATLEYKKPLPQPTVAEIPTCADGRQPGKAKQKDFQGKDPGDTLPPHDPSAQQQTAGRHLARPASGAAPEPGGPPMWLVYLPPLLALLVLAKVIVGSIPVLSRLRRRR
ncbi:MULTISPECIES: MCE family protein [Thermomonospora]|uniref:Virulence factor Mce family protein n=1 Tax=Thermomonospora curvata (strain ATCC 19995 / DSM 43183 / JCM 3096 / KCTC 9072 / NBRC 15933 / NCIMB 10081 / Henssen B9) TaxID=471852 RepID=D1AD45_THECD|nr:MULTISPECIES: MCE family protein [Thermomonospora]ACY99354.1 virulence factor Mce family protein [Thermomonospora curvata DSM 43183]PKK12404.1 MAG: virulence factor Mce family protein [Thermomonospora sp. CIF 1]